MDLRISPATVNHAAFACELAKANMRPYYKRYEIEWSDDSFLQEWKILESYIIYKAETEVGFMNLSSNGSFLYIRDIHLSEKYLDKGIGTWAISQATSIAKSRGLGSIRLKVFKDNPAKSFYERLGYLVVGTENNVLRMECPVAA
jgi:ribosomal protein S18 acetylase RimI-like enzyme